MGGFIIFNTFRTVVAERKRDLALLRAVGASRQTILGLILAEGVLQGLLGTVLGMAAGYAFGAALLSLTSGLMETYVHLRLGGPVASPGLMVVTVILGVGVTLLAGLLPALSATAVAPLDALRPAAPAAERRGRRGSAAVGAALVIAAAVGPISGNTALTGLGAVVFLVGLMLLAPALVQPLAVAFGGLLAMTFARDGTGGLAQGNLTRQPTRAAVTATTTMIALAIIVAVGGMVTSLRGAFLGILRNSLGGDFLILPPAVAIWDDNVGAGAPLAEQLRAVEGVETVSTLRFAASAAGDAPLSLLGVDPAVFPRVASLRFESGDPDSAYAALAAGRGLIANGLMATTLRLETGDVLRLATPSGPQDYTVMAIAGDFLNAKIVTAWISQAALAADFGKTEDIFYQVALAPGANLTRIEPQLAVLLGPYPQFRLLSSRAYFQQNALLFEQAFLSMYAMFIILAVPSLIAMLNTLAIGVIERTREIGLLRAVGTTQHQVWRIVIAEALLLAAIGTALGLLAGLYLGSVLVKALSLVGFALPYSFPLAGVVAAVVVGLLAGAAAALVPARQAARLEIVRALRYE
jgi:putative ABC transport system permease protein